LVLSFIEEINLSTKNDTRKKKKEFLFIYFDYAYLASLIVVGFIISKQNETYLYRYLQRPHGQ
jgi:hypothetical protein